jgi:hypothetical protein
LRASCVEFHRALLTSMINVLQLSDGYKTIVNF